MARRAVPPAPRPPVTLRERLAAHERPGTLRGGPPITIGCPCGARHDLAYGATWSCACGRTWDTGEIDPADYDRLRRVQWRFRILPVVLGLGVSVLAMFFLLTGNTYSMFLLLPAALIGWGLLLKPWHAARYRRALGELPRWRLTPR